MPRKTFIDGDVLPASDLNLLMNQSVMTFATAAARTTALPTPTEGMVSYLEDTNQLFIYSGSAWVAIATSSTNSYNLVQTLYYTSSGTFTKATYPWLRALKVKVQAAGGGGAGCSSTSHAGGGGGGGAYAEAFITDIASLSASTTVTRGAGGTGGIGNGTGANNGGQSAFGTITADGGFAGLTAPGTGQGGAGGSATANADILFAGSAGGPGSNSFGVILTINGPQGGSSFLGGGGQGAGSGTGNINNGQSGLNYGGGGGGAYAQNTSNSTGGAGANGIVILELYA